MKAVIQRYDPACTEAPFKMINLGEFEYTNFDLVTSHPDPACQHYALFRFKVAQQGYEMKFWSMEDGYDAAVVVE